MALSGDGGDELFAGYTRHRFARLASGMPAPIGRALACGLGVAGPALWERVFSLLPAERRPKLAADKMHKAARLFRAGEEGGYLSLVSAWDDPDALVNGGKEPKGPIFDAGVARALPDPLDRMQYLDTITYLPDDILTKVDRASMAVALEVRVPILDHRIVEFSWRLPARFKMRGGKGKWLLRAGALPPRAEGAGGAAKVGLRHTSRAMAQGTVARLGRGAPVGDAPRRRRVAQSGADPGAMGGASGGHAQLACFAVDSADVSGLAAATRDLSLAGAAPACTNLPKATTLSARAMTAGFSARCAAAVQ